MLSLGKCLVAYLAYVGLVAVYGRLRGRCRAWNLVLDDGSGLAQGIARLAFHGRSWGWLRGHSHLNWDSVAFRIPLPHGVGVVNEEVAVWQRGRHAHQLKGVGGELEARGSRRRRDGRPRQRYRLRRRGRRGG